MTPKLTERLNSIVSSASTAKEAAPTPPRKRRRERLLDATAELIVEAGDVDVPLSAIVERAGVNQALVKYHFGNKEGLLVALLSRNAADGVRRLERLAAMELPAVDKFRRHIAGTVRTYAQVPYWNRLMHALMSDGSAEAQAEIGRNLVQPVMDFHTALLAQGVGEGAFRPMEPLFFHLLIQGTCDHLFSARASVRYGLGKSQVDEDTRTKFVEQITSVMLNGLCSAK